MTSFSQTPAAPPSARAWAAETILDTAAAYFSGSALSLQFDRGQVERLFEMAIWRSPTETDDSRFSADGTGVRAERLSFDEATVNLFSSGEASVVTVACDLSGGSGSAAVGRHRVAVQNGGKLQAGYANLVRKISPEIRRRVAAHHAAGSAKVGFAGYGDGGALAAALVSDGLRAGFFSPDLRFETLVTFGEPAIANKAWVDAFDRDLAASGGRYWRVVNDRDPVPGSMLIKEQAGSLVYIAHDGHFFINPSRKLVSYRQNHEPRPEATA